jgi:hypothetical protein
VAAVAWSNGAQDMVQGRHIGTGKKHNASTAHRCLHTFFNMSTQSTGRSEAIEAIETVRLSNVIYMDDLWKVVEQAKMCVDASDIRLLLNKRRPCYCRKVGGEDVMEQATLVREVRHMWSVQHGTLAWEEHVRRLLDYGADPNIPSICGDRFVTDLTCTHMAKAPLHQQMHILRLPLLAGLWPTCPTTPQLDVLQAQWRRWHGRRRRIMYVHLSLLRDDIHLSERACIHLWVPAPDAAR